MHFYFIADTLTICSSKYPFLIVQQKQKVSNPCKFSQLHLLFCTHWRPEPRIASIHASQFSLLKQNKTCAVKKHKEREERKEVNTTSAQMKGEAQRVFVEHRYARSNKTYGKPSMHRRHRKKERIPHQCMTDVYLLYFLGQSVENMHLATSISEKL